MYVIGRLFQLLLGWNVDVSIIVTAAAVLVYILLGGLTSSIYNEVVQFFLIVFGFLPLMFLGVIGAGGWSGVEARLATVATDAGFAAAAGPSGGGTWVAIRSPMGIDWVGMVGGLVAMSFGYWSPISVIQRAIATRSMNAARRTPILAAIPKMFMPLSSSCRDGRARGAADGGHPVQRQTDYPWSCR